MAAENPARHVVRVEVAEDEAAAMEEDEHRRVAVRSLGRRVVARAQGAGGATDNVELEIAHRAHRDAALRTTGDHRASVLCRANHTERRRTRRDHASCPHEQMQLGLEAQTVPPDCATHEPLLNGARNSAQRDGCPVGDELQRSESGAAGHGYRPRA